MQFQTIVDYSRFPKLFQLVSQFFMFLSLRAFITLPVTSCTTECELVSKYKFIKNYLRRLILDP